MTGRKLFFKIHYFVTKFEFCANGRSMKIAMDCRKDRSDAIFTIPRITIAPK